MGQLITRTVYLLATAIMYEVSLHSSRNHHSMPLVSVVLKLTSSYTDFSFSPTLTFLRVFLFSQSGTGTHIQNNAGAPYVPDFSSAPHPHTLFQYCPCIQTDGRLCPALRRRSTEVCRSLQHAIVHDKLCAPSF